MLLVVLGCLLLIVSTPVATMAWIFGRDERRLKKRGRAVSAVCTEHIYRDSVTPVYVRCAFPADGHGETDARVLAPRPAPEVGDSFTVLYDPESPRIAQSAYGLRHPFASILLVSSTGAVVAGLLLGGAGALLRG
ncbi:hypothetical protein AB0K09_11805 [Streptomyces sp. NPDC049577]|uniref:hypothetical protein n=1 Tax=Streptomyces sp. NPDC049577 TaxID=3155153 RepID=UPI00343E532A